MLFSLEILPAKEGDCLLLHWRTDGMRKLAVIDGGPSGVYQKTLRPRLDELSQGQQLTIEFVAVSHVDADHITGIDDLFAALVADIGTPGNERPLRVRRLWHNTFNDILDDADDAYYTQIKANLTAAGEPLPSTRTTMAKSAAEKYGAEGEHLVEDISLILAGHAQARSLRDSWKALNDDNAILALNSPFTAGNGKASLIASHLTPAPKELEGLKITIAGPLKEDLDRLQKDFDKFIKQKGLTAEAVLAGYVDKSIPNLSSIVAVIECGRKSMLFTGDARGDKVLEGLDKAGKLKNGKAHFDILKVPHHGSSRNTEAGFFAALSADVYVLSADGKYENPDRSTVEWIIDSRGKNDSYEMAFTYTLDSIDKKRKADSGKHGKSWSAKKDGIEPLIAGKLAEGHKFKVSEGRKIVNLGSEKATA